MKSYCKSCGKANEYIGMKPSFCGFCGENFNASIITQTVKKNVIINSNKEEDEDYGPIDYGHNPFLGKTKVSFNKSDLNGDEVVVKRLG